MDEVNLVIQQGGTNLTTGEYDSSYTNRFVTDYIPLVSSSAVPFDLMGNTTYLYYVRYYNSNKEYLGRFDQDNNAAGKYSGTLDIMTGGIYANGILTLPTNYASNIAYIRLVGRTKEGTADMIIDDVVGTNIKIGNTIYTYSSV